MTGTRARTNGLVIDCADPERLATFRGEVPGRPALAGTGPYG